MQLDNSEVAVSYMIVEYQERNGEHSSIEVHGPALVNASTKNRLWYNATLDVDKAEERICKQAGECILLLSKWRSKISGLSTCMLACQSKPELHFKCFLKFLFRKRIGNI